MHLFFIFFWGGGGGHLFEAGRLLTFPTYRVGAYSRWALIQGWALINFSYLQGGRLFEVGTYSRWALIRGWALINFSYLQGGRLFEVGAHSRLGA